MAITLRRGDPTNIAAEVQRWQFFLLKKGYTDNRRVDGDFGSKTQDATVRFQKDHGLPMSAELDDPTIDTARTLGYTVLDRAYYTDPAKQGDAWPPKPAGLSTPSNASRNKHLTCFVFNQSPEGHRTTDALDGINIKASCDGTVADWIREFVMDVALPSMPGTVGFPSRMRCHRKVAPFALKLFDEWDRADLLHLVIGYSGDFVARYKRNRSPDPGGHGDKESKSVGALSNHAFASAFDINVAENGLDNVPAFIGRKGCVRELVTIANEIGFYWGGHFNSTRDGMHFEFAAFDKI